MRVYSLNCFFFCLPSNTFDFVVIKFDLLDFGHSRIFWIRKCLETHKNLLDASKLKASEQKTNIYDNRQSITNNERSNDVDDIYLIMNKLKPHAKQYSFPIQGRIIVRSPNQNQKSILLLFSLLNQMNQYNTMRKFDSPPFENDEMMLGWTSIAFLLLILNTTRYMHRILGFQYQLVRMSSFCRNWECSLDLDDGPQENLQVNRAEMYGNLVVIAV